jgi:hypothetical protein
MQRSSKLAAVLAGGTMLGSLVATGPALGVPIERGTEPIEFSEVVVDFCGVSGLDVRVDGAGTARYRLDRRGPGGNVYFAEHVLLDVRYTNLQNQEFATSHERSTFRDVLITENTDGTHTVIAFGTGNAYVADSSGTVIGRNPGQMRWEVVVDLNETPENFDDDVVISEEVILGSTGRNDDFCEAVVPALT